MVGNSIHDDVEPARVLGMRTCFLNTDGLNETPECDLVCKGADYEKLLQMIMPDAVSDEPARVLGMRTCFLNTDGLNETPECDLVCKGADYEKLLQMIMPDAVSDGAR